MAEKTHNDNNMKKDGRRLIPWKKIAYSLMVFDLIALNLSYYLALVIRFELHFELVPDEYLSPFFRFIPWISIICIVVFYMFRLYNSMWKYAGFNELVRIVEACVVVSVLNLIGTLIFTRRMPVSYYVIGAVFQLLLTVCSRFSYRILLSMRTAFKLRGVELANVMVIGSGPTAQLIIRELLASPDSGARPVCIITEQYYSWGRTMEGIPIVGGRDKITDSIEKFDIKKIVLADPLLPMTVKDEILKLCNDSGCEVQNFAGSGKLDTRGINLRKLLELIDGRLLLSIDGKDWEYDSAVDALPALTAKYNLLGISTLDDKVKVALAKDIVTPSDLSKQWVDEYIRDYGENPSFF